MTTYRGCEGEVIINDGGGAQTVAEVTAISITRTANNSSFKTFGSCDNRTENLSKEWSGSIEGRYSNDDPGQVQLEEGEIIALQYFPGGSGGATPPEFAGNVRIDELTIDASAEETVTFSASFTGDGALTKNNTY